MPLNSKRQPMTTSQATIPSETEAWITTSYGPPDVLKLETEALSQLERGQILIAGKAWTVSAGDSRVRALRLPRGFGPIGKLVLGYGAPRCRVLGSDIAGEVVSVGPGVVEFKVGDRVIGFTGEKMACHTTYKVFDTKWPITKIPDELTYTDAVAVPFGGVVALNFMSKVKLPSKAEVLVVGATGAVGASFVQFCKHLGARVTSVCSKQNIELAKVLGADTVVAYDLEIGISQLRGHYDLIVDTVGKDSYQTYQHLRKQNAPYISVSGGIQDNLYAAFKMKNIIAGPTPLQPELLTRAINLASKGVFRPNIDRLYRFVDIREAHSHVDSGHKKGSVVIVK